MTGNIVMQRGFTLIELIVSLLLVAILSAVTAVFVQAPLDSYLTSRQRLDLADSAELALRRMAQEVRTALPNSVRTTNVGGVTYIEFLAARTQGRYRVNAGGPGGACAGGNQLAFGVSDNCLTSIGQINNGAQIVANSDYLVVNNLGPGFAFDAYQNAVNKSRITAYTAALGAPVESRLRFTAHTFPAASPSNIFYVVSGPVMYACNPATGQVLRYSGYPINPVQVVPPVGGRVSVIVGNVTACRASYVPNAAVLDSGLLVFALTLTRSVPGHSEVEPLNLMAQMPVSKMR